MWPFKKKVTPPQPRYVVKVNGYGEHTVRAGAGYVHEIDDYAGMKVEMHFNKKTFANIQQAELAIAAFESHIAKIADVQQVKEIF